MKIFSRIGRPERGDILAALPGQALILSLVFSLISISLEQTLFFLAVVLWAVRMIRDKARLAVPRFCLPLAVYAALSLVSAAFSVNRLDSFRDSRDLALLLMVPLAYTAFRDLREIGRANIAILVSAVASLAYSGWHLVSRALPGERLQGFMGHYMTQAGLLVLFAALAMAMVLFGRGKVRWIWAAAFLLTCPALVLTQTRSAWIGLAVAAAVLLFLYRRILLLAVPLVGIVAYLVSPAPIKERAKSVFNSQAYSNRLRLEYVRAGARIIKRFPVLGTGPDTVELEFQNPRYGLSEEAKLLKTHLHNDYLQIAAERGLPALAAWLAFVVWALLDLARIARGVITKGGGRGGGSPGHLPAGGAKGARERDPVVFPLAAAALAALLAFLAAGFFEYNWGDSEITILLLFIVTAPFAALRLRSAA